MNSQISSSLLLSSRSCYRHLESIECSNGCLECWNGLRQFGLALVLEGLSRGRLALGDNLFCTDDLACVLHLLRLLVNELHHLHILFCHLQQLRLQLLQLLLHVGHLEKEGQRSQRSKRARGGQ